MSAFAVELAKFGLDSFGEHLLQLFPANRGPIFESGDAADQQRSHAAAVRENHTDPWKLPRVAIEHKTEDGSRRVHRPLDPGARNSLLFIRHRCRGAARRIVRMYVDDGFTPV